MRLDDLYILFGHHPEVKVIDDRIKKGDSHILLAGLHASARALTLAHVSAPLFVIFDNAESAQYMYSDLKALGAQVSFFPHSQKRRAVDEAAQIQRTETLTTLTSNYSPLTIITYPEAIAEPVPAKEVLSAISFQLSVGQEERISDLGKRLSDLGFEHVDFVFQPGRRPSAAASSASSASPWPESWSCGPKRTTSSMMSDRQTPSAGL